MVGAAEANHNYMVAVAKTIRELIEIRKFAVDLEEVWYVEYDKSKFAGKHITKAEAEKKDLKMAENDDDWNDEL